MGRNAILKQSCLVSICFVLLTLFFPALLIAWDGKVVSITDGDTIKVLKDGKQFKIRLASIDCPEKGQSYGLAATKYTANLVAGKVVKIWTTDTDRYGRTVAFVFVGDKNLNKELLSVGLAWHYQKYSRGPELAKLEFEARAKKIRIMRRT